MSEKATGFEMLLVFLVAIASMVLHGAIFSVLWEWFFVPLGLPGISIVHAMGIGITIAWLTKPASKKPTDKDSLDKWENIRRQLESFKQVWIYDLITFGTLYIVHVFV